MCSKTNHLAFSHLPTTVRFLTGFSSKGGICWMAASGHCRQPHWWCAALLIVIQLTYLRNEFNLMVNHLNEIYNIRYNC